jgi:hypothetical protein
MGEVEENFSQNDEMTMIIEKIGAAMCAAS